MLRSKWQVNAIAKNKAEVASPRIRYVIQADSTSFTLQAFKDNRSVEKVSLKHKGRNYSLAGVDSTGRGERQTIRFTGKRVLSSGVIGGKRFAVSSSVCVHIPLLVEQLKGRKPIRLPHISAFLAQFKRDDRLRGQLRRQVDMAMMLRAKDSVIFACLIICAECYLIGTPIACTLCDLCLRPDPPT
jgi:hypothetical protein